MTAHYDPDSPFYPPYHKDHSVELPLVQLHLKDRALFESRIQSLHQEHLSSLLTPLTCCPELLPILLHPNCPPCDSEIVRSERIHAVFHLLAQLREHQHQQLLRLVYKTFGSDHRRAARELYTHELFSAAYIQYYALYTALPIPDADSKSTSKSKSNSTAATIDLLEKLAITCLRANWPADAERFATQALRYDRGSLRARIWLATAQLALGNLTGAQKNLALLPKRGGFPPDFPPWIEGRVLAQRMVLARLEREANGKYDLMSLTRDPVDAMPAGPHFMTVSDKILRSPANGYRTLKPVKKGELLLVLHPDACAPCYTAHAPNADSTTTSDPTTAPSPIPTTRSVHDEDPSLLTLSLLVDMLYMTSKTRKEVRKEVFRLGMEANKVIVEFVENKLLAAAIHVVQGGSVAVPSGANGGGKSMHGGHAVYLPLLDLKGGEGKGNTYATFVGSHLFLRASNNLERDSVLVFDGFDVLSNYKSQVDIAPPMVELESKVGEFKMDKPTSPSVSNNRPDAKEAVEVPTVDIEPALALIRP